MDILIEGEKIAAVGHDLQAEDAKVIDAEGKLLFPGFIDGHTHFDLEVAGTVTADDFETGTKAAILGGTTLDHRLCFAGQGWSYTQKKVSKNGIKKQITNVPVTILSTCQS